MPNADSSTSTYRFGDEQFSRLAHGLGVERGGDPPEQSNLKDAQIEAFAKSELGKDFCIFGPNLTSWRISVAHAAFSGLMRGTKRKDSDSGSEYIEIPEKYYPALIEAAVRCIYWGSYSATKPFQFKYILHKSHLLDRKIPTFARFHVDVYYFGKYLRYPNLTIVALNKLQEVLLSETEPFGIESFKELVEFVWKPQDYASINTMLSAQKDDWDLRSLLATFGAIWDPAWRAHREDVWEELTAPNGKYQNYAFWHMAAKRDIERKPDREIAPMVKLAMQKEVDMEDN